MSAPNRRGNSRSQRGGRDKPHQQYARQAEKTIKSFAEASTMGSAKFQVAKRKQATLAAKEAEYLGEPPSDQSLFNARLVLPGGHRLPHGLDSPTAFDTIRRTHQVWITRPAPNALHITSKSVPGLQAAVQAINWAIHDMRLSNEHPVVRFLVQKPIRATPEATIKLELGSRPCVVGTKLSCDIESAFVAHKGQIGEQIVPATENLMALAKDLKMRVNFGFLNVRQKKKGIGSDFTYGRFADVIRMYSLRGGASLETRLVDIQAAERTVHRLADPGTGIFLGMQDVTYGCNLTLVVQDSELRAEAQILANHAPQLAMARMATPETSARLNWTMASPDMEYDWNLRADAWDAVGEVPSDLQELLKRTSLKFDSINSTGLTSLKFPVLQMRHTGNLGQNVRETRLQTTATIPYRDTPWVIEVNATQAWKGLDTSIQPEVHWGIHVYGIHWDDAMNQMSADGRRKDWGEGLKYIWPGTESWESRFGDFLAAILQVQIALEKEEESDGSLL